VVDNPIERTIVWDRENHSWHEQETGVSVLGLGPPGAIAWKAPSQPAQKQAEWFSPQQRAEVEEMIDRTARCLIDKALPSRAENESIIHASAERWATLAAKQYLDSRTTNAQPMAYFAPADDMLVTYRALNAVMLEVQQLRTELWILRLPWWKRWFKR
jgi:hypothetical protein